MLSGGNQVSTIVEAVRLGAADYVVKPDDPEGLGEIALDVAIKNAIEKNRLVSELTELRQQLSDDEDRAVWGNSEKMRGIATVIEQVADSDVTVLIRGESGVGKELVCARDPPAVHSPESAVREGQLRGAPGGPPRERALRPRAGRLHRRATTRIGKFEQADGGTLMLDEIGEMKPALQAKLLHVLQDAEFTKLGSNKRIQVDVRVVAATNRDLEKMLVSGDFREDLYYRLKVIELTVPSLRERRDEIPTLTDFFVARYSRKYNRPVKLHLGRAAAAVPDLRLARQHPRARKHDQADRRAPGRAAGGRGNPAQHVKAAAAAQQVAPPPPVMVGAAVGIPIGSTAVAAIGAGGSRSCPSPLRSLSRFKRPSQKTMPSLLPGGGSLAAVAKAAAMKAERAAIEQTLAAGALEPPQGLADPRGQL